jgi:hypothetical protein
MNDLLLPPGTRLLHIGPHKTGTTALQIALGKNRDALLRQGVRYIWGGEHLNANLAALAVAKRPTRRFSSAKPVPIEHWTSLVEKANLAAAEERLIISGEEFCSIDEATIKQVVQQLDPKRLHIVITLRPLEKILVSQWQQYVQGGSVTLPLSVWAESVLERDESIERVAGFWERHDHVALIKRWLKHVGNKNMTVIILNEQDRDHLFRSVERLTGLSSGAIVPDERLINRSLSHQEAEAIRSMYSLLRERDLGHLSDHVRFMISPSELIKRERRPLQVESKISLNGRYIARVREIGLELVKTLASSGVRTIGNVDGLVPEEVNVESLATTETAQIPSELAGWTAYGVIVSSGISRGDLPPAPTSTLPFVWLRRATGPQLMREVMRRVRIRVLQPFSRLRSEKKKGDGL